MNYLQYILMVSVCLGIFYASWALIFRIGLRLEHARIYLLISVVLSLLIPLSDLSIDTGFHLPEKDNPEILVVTQTFGQEITSTVSGDKGIWDRIMENPGAVLLRIYVTVSIFFLLRLIFTIAFLSMKYRRSYKFHLPECVLLYNHGFKSTISFFRWIFVQTENVEDDDLSKIIEHEKIHACQYHSADIMLIELLTAVMWFNPIVWMINRSMKLVHEYLADDGALRSGISIPGYQALLINQIAGEKLVVLSSSFNNSLIKKRITMITKSNKKGESPFKILSILPVAIFIFILTAALNGIQTKDAKASASQNFAVINSEPDMGTARPDLPPDTIVKKTIIKKVSRDNPNDTVVIEKEEIITGDDVQLERHAGENGRIKHVTIIDEDGEMRHTGEFRHRDMRTDADTFIVRPHRNGFVIRDNRMQGDTVRHVKTFKRADDNVVIEDEKVIIVERPEHESDILYIVDGEKMTDKKAIEVLNPDEIQSVSVIKGEEAAKYGRNYSGVIMITSKKSKK